MVAPILFMIVAVSGVADVRQLGEASVCHAAATADSCQGLGTSTCYYNVQKQMCEEVSSGSFLLILVTWAYLGFAVFSPASNLKTMCDQRRMLRAVLKEARLLPHGDTLKWAFKWTQEEGHLGEALADQGEARAADNWMQLDTRKDAFVAEMVLQGPITVASGLWFLFAAWTTGFTKVPSWAMILLPALSLRSMLLMAELTRKTIPTLAKTSWVAFFSSLPSSFDGPSHLMGALNIACRTTDNVHHRTLAYFAFSPSLQFAAPLLEFGGNFTLALLAAAVLLISYPTQLGASMIPFHGPLIASQFTGLAVAFKRLHPDAVLNPLLNIYKFFSKQFIEVLLTLIIQTIFKMAIGCPLGSDPVGTFSLFLALLMSIKSVVEILQKPAQAKKNDAQPKDVQTLMDAGNDCVSCCARCCAVPLAILSFCVLGYCIYSVRMLELCPSGEGTMGGGCIPLCEQNTVNTSTPWWNVTCMPMTQGCR